MAVNRKAGLSELVVRFDPRLDQLTNPPTSWKLEHSATMRVIEANQPVIIEDAQTCNEFPAYLHDSRLRGYRTVVVLPLGTTDGQGREMTIAVHSRQKIAVSETELAFLITVTQLASIAVEKAKRLQLETDRAHRLRQTIEISTLLMERVLAESSMDAVVEIVAAVVPHPLIIADLTVGTFSVRRSPVPRVMGEPDWKRFVAHELGQAIADLVRSAAASGFKTGRELPIVHAGGSAMLHPVVEPLQVHEETVGGLVIFPPDDGIDDLDGIVAHAAKLALNVQLMRDYVRFRSEANSVAELFKTLFAGPPRNPAELVARARRLGVNLPGPARLVAIGLAGDGGDAGAEPRASGLHLSLARAASELRSGTAVILDDDLVVFAPVAGKEEPANWDGFVRGVVTAAEGSLGARPIVAESRICRRFADYREARLECARVIALARLFGKTGRVTQADFGPFAVLLSAVDQSTAQDFVRTTLGAIEEYDVRNGTEFLPTLAEFVRDGCRYQACADRLGIHVSTLRYRLDRLHERFGIDLGHPDSVFGLTLALRLRDLGACAGTLLSHPAN